MIVPKYQRGWKSIKLDISALRVAQSFDILMNVLMTFLNIVGSSYYFYVNFERL